MRGIRLFHDLERAHFMSHTLCGYSEVLCKERALALAAIPSFEQPCSYHHLDRRTPKANFAASWTI